MPSLSAQHHLAAWSQHSNVGIGKAVAPRCDGSQELGRMPSLGANRWPEESKMAGDYDTRLQNLRELRRKTDAHIRVIDGKQQVVHI